MSSASTAMADRDVRSGLHAYFAKINFKKNYYIFYVICKRTRELECFFLVTCIHLKSGVGFPNVVTLIFFTSVRKKIFFSKDIQPNSSFI